MFLLKFNCLSVVLLTSLLGLSSCENNFKSNDFTAYFGGEIVNPSERFVLLLKDETLIDTLFLDKENRFFKKFDSLAPGLYTFKHLPEYQYVYFDKNDSLMVRVNSDDFDNSVVFCGRGDEKNNYFMEAFLENEKSKEALYSILDKDINVFNEHTNSHFKTQKKIYETEKQEQNWSTGFDSIALAQLQFNYYFKKELYPYAHQIKTGAEIYKQLPKDFYAYRNDINLNNENFTSFTPFVKYVSMMLTNRVYEKQNVNYSEMSLASNIEKLNLTDSFISNRKIKNSVLNQLASLYLLEDQNMNNNTLFVKRYLELSTDKVHNKEIQEIANAVQNLIPGKTLSNIDLIDEKGNTVLINDITKNKKTVFFFWSSMASSHIKAAHNKVMTLQNEYPNIQFIAINIKDSKENWLNALSKHNFKGIRELKSVNFEEIQKNWVLNKVHRVIITNEKGEITNGFSNLFDVNFAKNNL